MTIIKPLLLAVLVTTALGAQARYNGEDRGRPVMPSEVNAKWQAECGSCHMAYPPGLLPAASWKKVMAGLDKHFGTDASLSAADAQEITRYLTKYPSNRWDSNAAPLRITDGEWFKAKHLKGEIAPEVWKRASVNSPGNCNACHTGAAKGDFNEHNISIPK
ncbi:MAG: cytochrome C [Comamonadaceae bacterium CG1_02_60_18]|nr:MAG: cytochrome C [Comamonadaceae bacterium CG1_02_60_18]PIQ55099.1 MAG: cytochrome C [Comamonadaceae bacterium CG12_big_fil_rev_8_21_14_0_65_59_15]